MDAISAGTSGAAAAGPIPSAAPAAAAFPAASSAPSTSLLQRIAAVEAEIGEVKARRDRHDEGSELWMRYADDLKQLRDKELLLRHEWQRVHSGTTTLLLLAPLVCCCGLLASHVQCFCVLVRV